MATLRALAKLRGMLFNRAPEVTPVIAARPASGRVRKQVYELTLEDLERHPVWEFALDEEGEEGQDEATVRPVNSAEPVDPAAGMFVIRAGFTLADGSELAGYLTPQIAELDKLGFIQPIIVTELGQVGLWSGMVRPDGAELQRNYSFIGRDAPHVFPLRFKSAVPVTSGPVEGTVDGFLFYEDYQQELIGTVQ